MTSVNPEGGDWDADTLEGKGLSAVPVDGYLRGEAAVVDSAVEVIVGSGQAILLYSSPIPLRPGPVTVSLKVSVSGSSPPRQLRVGLAGAASGSPEYSKMLYSLLSGSEIPETERQLLLTYDLESSHASFIFEIIGPIIGVATVRLGEIRVFPGWWPTDLALGPTRLALHEDFESERHILQTKLSTGGAHFALFSGDTHGTLPGGLGHSALMRTFGPDEVLETYLAVPEPLSPVRLPANLEARVWLRRTPNSTGNFALSLSDDDQSVVTVLPIDDLPTERWRLVRTGGMFTTQGAVPPFIVLQAMEGPATVFVDDIELHAPHDKIELWDAAYRPTSATSPIPTTSPTRTPIPTSTPTPSPTPIPELFIEIISATASVEPGATSSSVWVVGIDGHELEEPYLAPVTPASSLLKPVTGTTFISSGSRTGLERSSDNPERILFRMRFDLPDSFSNAHLHFVTSHDGIVRLTLNGSHAFAALGRAPQQQPEEITFGQPEGFRPGLNELEIELQNGRPKTLAVSFRLVVTYEQSR